MAVADHAADEALAVGGNADARLSNSGSKDSSARVSGARWAGGCASSGAASTVSGNAKSWTLSDFATILAAFGHQPAGSAAPLP
jgi:hypothetical protein